MTLRQDFAKSDSQFKRMQALRSAAIATDRSENERVARYSKQSGTIQSIVLGVHVIARASIKMKYYNNSEDFRSLNHDHKYFKYPGDFNKANKKEYSKKNM